MRAIIDEVEISQVLEWTVQRGVTCIFCGLSTPVDSAAQSQLETWPMQPNRRLSIVRCEICGKEAPYHSGEVTDFSDVFQARRKYFVEKEQRL